MTAPNAVPVASVPVSSVTAGEPIRALRLHARRDGGGVPCAPRVQQLLDLKQRETQRAAAVQAVLDLVRDARAAVATIPEQVTRHADEVARLAVELGLSIARELVGDALQRGLVDPTPTVLRCLRDCVHGSDRGDLVVRLHPHDLAVVQTALQSAAGLQDEVAAARFVADPTVPRGGVRAETGAGRLRYDPRDVLERMCDEVRREASHHVRHEESS
jgi:flagellar biosynthesis/type III secretory pathway protein FliH